MNGVFVAAINRTGDDEGGMIKFYGSSFVGDPCGKIVADAPRDEPALLIATLDFSTFNFWRKLFPLIRQRQPDTYAHLLKKVE